MDIHYIRDARTARPILFRGDKETRVSGPAEGRLLLEVLGSPCPNWQIEGTVGHSSYISLESPGAEDLWTWKVGLFYSFYKLLWHLL